MTDSLKHASADPPTASAPAGSDLAAPPDDDGPSLVEMWQPVSADQMVRTGHLAVAVSSGSPDLVTLDFLDEHGTSGGCTFDYATARAIGQLLEKVATGSPVAAPRLDQSGITRSKVHSCL
jgi:hypothetical protein